MEFDDGPLNDEDLLGLEDRQNFDFDEDEDAERLQAEEKVLNNHLECVK